MKCARKEKVGRTTRRGKPDADELLERHAEMQDSNAGQMQGIEEGALVVSNVSV